MKEQPDSYPFSYFVGRFFAHVGLGLSLIILTAYLAAVALDWTKGSPSNQFVLCVAVALLLFVVGFLIMIRKR